MNYLPWIAGGAALGYLFSPSGRPAKGEYRTRHGTIPTHDAVTGEPLPPYAGRGRPRAYNSYATKRAAVLQDELLREGPALSGDHGHIWNPGRLHYFIDEMSLPFRNQFNLAAVCDGHLKFRGDPELFARGTSSSKSGRGKKLYKCVPRPGTSDTGEVMTYGRYQNLVGKRRRRGVPPQEELRYEAQVEAQRRERKAAPRRRKKRA